MAYRDGGPTDRIGLVAAWAAARKGPNEPKKRFWRKGVRGLRVSGDRRFGRRKRRWGPSRPLENADMLWCRECEQRVLKAAPSIDDPSSMGRESQELGVVGRS